VTLTLESLRTSTTLTSGVVALLFAADEPLDLDQLSSALLVTRRDVEKAASELAESPPAGLILQRHGDSFQLVTEPRWADAVTRLRAGPPVKLSRATLEVLAIVAYRQPVTRADIDQLRGVNSDRAVATLASHGLIEEVGRRDTVGRPVLFATTLQLLERMGIGSLSELPSLEELAAIEPGPSPDGNIHIDPEQPGNL
jgi:segregation and condensation protein B